MSGPLSEAAQALLVQARQLAQDGDLRAASLFNRLLTLAPDCIEARIFLAGVSLANGDPLQATAQMRLACASEPDNPHLGKSLATAAFAAGRLDEARSALQRTLEQAPYLYEAHLLQGKVLERQGDRHGATRAYFRAVTRAQVAEQWLSEAGIPPRLLADVLHAMDFVRAGRVEILQELLTPLQEQHGGAAMQRVDAALAGYLGMAPSAPPDARQRPKFLYFPGLPDAPYLALADFDWIPRLEAAFTSIRDEASAVLADQSTLTPFLEFGAKDRPQDFLAGAEQPPRWDAFFFYRHGEGQSENQQRCPLTSRVLESLPLVRIADHAPEICFSVLSAGTHILPHHGVTNVRVVVHLPLIVPEPCALIVGGERHDWQEGRCVAFDDTFEHEAWNRSAQSRVILLMDAWNPALTLPERQAMTTLIEGIGELNRG
ncbi:MAG: aspartyl/asparaginyl beta-hydroxylase domain-containing protein [Arenimonas sp.]